MKLHDKRYDVVIPFGHTCAAAMYSRDFGFRTCFLPFDWVGSRRVGVKGLAGFILNGFDGFMVPEQLEPFEMHSTRPGNTFHDSYWNPTNKLVFIHDFRKGVPLADEGGVVKERYARRIRRLYDILGSSKRKLLFCWCTGEHPSVEALVEMMGLLRRKFPQGELDLLVMETVADFEGVETVRVAPGITLVRGYFHNMTLDPTMGDCELSCRVLKTVSVRGCHRERLCRAIRRLMFKFRTFFEVDLRKRRQLRQRRCDEQWGR